MRTEGRREGVRIFDEKGRALLDGVSGEAVFNLGRRPETLAAALAAAVAETDQGNFPMISSEKADLAEALARFCPGHLDCAVFGVMRGESMEFACKAARGRTGRMPLVTFDGAWHGETGFALSLSDRPDAERMGPLVPGVRTVPFGDPDELEKTLKKGAAAVVLEPVQVENGCRVAEPDFLRAVRDLCTRYGALLVLDETQTGFGRTGRRFACDAAGIAPDILVLGEALGAGIFPITAAVFTQEVNRFLNAHPMIHLSTFGGSDVGCRVALAALREYERLEPWENARSQGEALADTLRRRAVGRPGGPRAIYGLGLLLALEYADADAARRAVAAAEEAGLFLRTARRATHCLLVRPPLTISEQEIAEVAASLSTPL